jgi:hypothetical protein
MLGFVYVCLLAYNYLVILLDDNNFYCPLFAIVLLFSEQLVQKNTCTPTNFLFISHCVE